VANVGVFGLFCTASCNRFEKVLQYTPGNAVRWKTALICWLSVGARPTPVTSPTRGTPGHTWVWLVCFVTPGKIFKNFCRASVGVPLVAYGWRVPCRGNAHPLLYGVRFVRFLAAGSLLNALCLVTVFLLLFTENFTALSRLCIPFYTCYFCYFFTCSSPVRWWVLHLFFYAVIFVRFCHNFQRS